MILISKTVNIDILDDIVNKYNNTYSTINIRSVDVTSNTYIDCSKETNEKDKLIMIN